MRVAFVYAGGRLGRGAQGPSDFFYGARELQNRLGWDVRLVDADAKAADLPTGFFAGRLAKRFLPPRTSADWIARSRRLLPHLRGCDAVVATTTELSFGLALWKSWGFLPQPLFGILCGAVNYPIGSELRRKWTVKLLSKMHPILFADTEKSELLRRFGPREISIGWFGVDENFWTPSSEPMDRRGILSVGNDGRRDYATLIEAARAMPQESFTFVTRREPPAALPANVIWRRGDWRGQAVSDGELRELYRSAACLVVPLLESPQPSGQSVAMQAIMCGAPVVHARTAGWWGAEVIRDGEHIVLVEPRSSLSLEEGIGKAVSAGMARNKARSALLSAQWTTKGFAERISEIVERSSAPS